MSRLEALRKQAKQLVRWHREGNYSVGGRIRGLPRYRHLTDAEALKLKFPLSEAQEILAREGGFESWAALKSSVESDLSKPKAAVQSAGSSTKPGAGAPSIKAAIPVVFVSSVANTAAFFRDELGFTIEFQHGKPAFYGGVSRDGVVVHLRFVHEPVIAQELRQKESLLAAFIMVENVKALFEEYKMRGVPMAGTLHKEAWGGPTFTVRDPDGNLICFCAV